MFAKRRAELKLKIEALEKQRSSLIAPSGIAPPDVMLAKCAELERKLDALRSKDLRIAGFEEALLAATKLENERAAARNAKAAAVKAKVAARAAVSLNDLVSQTGASVPKAVDQRTRCSIEVRSGSARSAERQDQRRHLFLGSSSSKVDTVPRRTDPAAKGLDDPMVRRALTIVEIPGLAHTLVLAERGQRVLDLQTISVPDECLGLPAAPSFAPHVFSARALSALSDPQRAEPFLKELGKADSEGR